MNPSPQGRRIKPERAATARLVRVPGEHQAIGGELRPKGRQRWRSRLWSSTSAASWSRHKTTPGRTSGSAD